MCNTKSQCTDPAIDGQIFAASIFISAVITGIESYSNMQNNRMSQAQGPVHKAIEDKIDAVEQTLSANGAREIKADHAAYHAAYHAACNAQYHAACQAAYHAVYRAAYRAD